MRSVIFHFGYFIIGERTNNYCHATEETSDDDLTLYLTQSTFNDSISCELDRIHCSHCDDPYTMQYSDVSSVENISEQPTQSDEEIILSCQVAEKQMSQQDIGTKNDRFR